jgi:hypothetical protein
VYQKLHLVRAAFELQRKTRRNVVCLLRAFKANGKARFRATSLYQNQLVWTWGCK